MALNFYCGSPGAGKSYHVVRYVIIPALQEGRNILTNLPLKLQEIYQAYPELKDQENEVRFIDKDKIENIHLEVDKQEYAGWLIVIDEAHDYWPSYKQIKNEDFRSWLSQHRHKFQDIILVTQDFTNVNRYIRTFIKERFEFEKNDVRGSSKSYMQDHFLKESKKRTKREIHRYNPIYFNYYHSHDIGLAGSGFKEQRTGKKINLMKIPFLMTFGGVGLAVIGLIMLVSNISGGMGSDSEEVENKTVSRPEIIPANSPKIEVLPVKTVSGGSSSSITGPVAMNWCKNVVRSWAGVGADRQGIIGKLGINGHSMSGGTVELKGAYIVTGAMIMPGKAIYFVKDLKFSIYKVVFVDDKYGVGQKICL